MGVKIKNYIADYLKRFLHNEYLIYQYNSVGIKHRQGAFNKQFPVLILLSLYCNIT